jgi:hypothetical protein
MPPHRPYGRTHVEMSDEEAIEKLVGELMDSAPLYRFGSMQDTFHAVVLERNDDTVRLYTEDRTIRSLSARSLQQVD